MKPSLIRKIGRRGAGSWGRPTGKYQKRMGAKAVRRYLKKEK
jgi:hypothetical protein